MQDCVSCGKHVVKGNYSMVWKISWGNFFVFYNLTHYYRNINFINIAIIS